MAHTLTRLEGFELGTLLSINGDVVTGAGVTVQTTTKRTGDYAAQVAEDGVSAHHLRLSLSFTGVGATSTTDLFAACSYRFYLYITAYPSASSIVWTLETKTPGFTPRHIVTMSTAGALTVDGTAGSTILALATWYKIDCIYDSASTGSVSLRIDGIPEVTGVTPTSNGTVGTLRFGKTTNANTYTIVVDDIAIEAAAAVTSVDYPAPGGVIGLDLDGNGAGFLNSYSWAIAGSAPPATRWEASNRPHDGNASHIGVSGVGTRKQTFTVESPTSAGLGGIINAVMFCQTSRNTGACNVKMLAGSSNFTTVGAGAVTAITTLGAVPAGTAFHYEASMRQTNPFTLAPWTTTDLENLVIGIHTEPGGGSVYRHTTSSIMVDTDTEPGATVDDTFLQEALYPRGLLRSVTNYTPELRTVRITSEAYGVPNEAFNIIAVSIRHVPSGVGVIRGVWFFDQNATASFTMANNPLDDAVMDSEDDDTSFLLDSSETVDGQQVYTEYIPIEGSGKIFELSITQEGDRCMEILAIDVEIQPEGRKPAYLREQF